MEASYWHQLQWIIAAAEMLQRAAVPESDLDCQQLRARVRNVVFELRACLDAVAPHNEVWAGKPPSGSWALDGREWDWLMKTSAPP